MIKLLLGGSPCTYWSIAQKNNRETEPSGMGWDLFKNYLIAKEKFKPDFFLYENNKSAAQAIKDEIKKQFGVWDGTFLTEDTGARYIEINSALVSAQNRQRFYVHNCGEVGQPEDRCILLKDILESGQGWTEKSHAMTASYDGAVAWNTLERHQRTMVAEPVIFQTPRGNNEGGCKYKKSPTLTANGSWQDNNRVVEPIKKYLNDKNMEHLMRPFGAKGKIVSEDTDKSPTVLAAAGAGGGNAIYYAERTDGKTYPVYEVRNGLITIKGKQYPIKLKDGFYIIRKLTVTECCRLQTMPDDYCRAVSASQAYKGLGNGWTAEVIIHILSHALKDLPRDEKILVLSMYDGIGTGRYCLDKMGFTNVEYHACEIDKYAMQIAMSNYPDIIQHGDAFQVREEYWGL